MSVDCKHGQFRGKLWPLEQKLQIGPAATDLGKSVSFICTAIATAENKQECFRNVSPLSNMAQLKPCVVKYRRYLGLGHRELCSQRSTIHIACDTVTINYLFTKLSTLDPRGRSRVLINSVDDHSRRSLFLVRGSEGIVVGHDVATALYVLHHLFLQQTNVLLQLHHHRAQLRVFSFQQFHLVLQLGDPFQLSPAALGGGYPVPLSLALELYLLLALHVDGGERRGGTDAGNRLGFVFDHDARVPEGVTHGVVLGHRHVVQVGIGGIPWQGGATHQLHGLQRALRAVAVVQLVEGVHKPSGVHLLLLRGFRREQDLCGGSGSGHAVLGNDEFLELRGGELQHVDVR